MLREENEDLLKELRVSVEAERAAERSRLEAQNRQEMEHLRVTLEEELRAERTRLRGEKEETSGSLKQEVTGNDADLLASASFLILVLCIVQQEQQEKRIVVVGFYEILNVVAGL